MDEPIGMTLHLRNNAPNPIGGYGNFLIYSDVTLPIPWEQRLP